MRSATYNTPRCTCTTCRPMCRLPLDTCGSIGSPGLCDWCADGDHVQVTSAYRGVPS